MLPPTNRRIAIDSTAAGIDADTVMPANIPRYAFAPPSTTARIEPRMMTPTVSSGSDCDAGMKGSTLAGGAEEGGGGALISGGIVACAEPASTPPDRYSTMTRSLAARPNVSGKYISSALVGGTTKLPGVVARATYVYSQTPSQSSVVNASTRSSRMFWCSYQVEYHHQ